MLHKLLSIRVIDYEYQTLWIYRTDNKLCSVVNEIAERLAFFAVGVSMVGYLVREMHESLPTAATHVTDWIGAAYVLTILGAFLADAYLGRFLTIIVFSCIYAVVFNYRTCISEILTFC